MAIAPENRGGFRPTAPQNNPANVSGTGGAGQSGDYSGFAYGQNKALNESRVAGNKAVASMAPRPVNMPPASGVEATPITDATSRPDENVMAGLTPYGQPNDPSALGLPQAPDNAQFNQSLNSYAPVLDFIQSRPETSKETRQALQLLMRGRGD
jgi:hypothetical protein